MGLLYVGFISFELKVSSKVWCIEFFFERFIFQLATELDCSFPRDAQWVKKSALIKYIAWANIEHFSHEQTHVIELLEAEVKKEVTVELWLFNICR